MSAETAEIYRRYAPMVLRRCRRLLGDDGRARDATHDVFVQLLLHRGPLHAHGLASLLFCIATRVCLNRLRALRRRPEDPASALLCTIAAADDGPRLDARALLDRLLSREPVSSRTIAVLHFVDGMTLDEVARAVGLSVSGVRKRLRALQARAGALAEASPPAPESSA